MTASSDSRRDAPDAHLPSLAVGLGIMVAGTLYPPLMARPAGGADHLLATLLFWAMSAGFVRGMGFIPRHAALRRLFSGAACAAALLAAAGWKLAA